MFYCVDNTSLGHVTHICKSNSSTIDKRSRVSARLLGGNKLFVYFFLELMDVNEKVDIIHFSKASVLILPRNNYPHEVSFYSRLWSSQFIIGLYPTTKVCKLL